MLIIEVKKGNVEGALKQFKSKVIKTKQNQNFTFPPVFIFHLCRVEKFIFEKIRIHFV